MPLFPPRATGGLGAQEEQPGGLGGFLGGAFGGLSRFNERHPGLLLGGGLALQGESLWPAISYGQTVRKTRKADAETERKRKEAIDLLVQEHGMDPGKAKVIVDSGAAGNWLKPPKGAGEVDYSQVPVYGTDPKTGKTVLGVIGDNATFKPLDTGGIEINGGMEKVDAGTEWLIYDKRTNQLVDRVPKDIAGVEEQKEIGKGRGEAAASLESIESKLPGLESTVAQLDSIAEKATYTLGGQAIDWANRQAGLEPRDAAIARQQYIATVSNQILPLLRDTFGAQFTAREGDVLMATLGDPDMAPKEKQAVLRAFIEQKKRDVQALRSRVGQGAAAPAGSGGRRTTKSGVNYEVE